MRDEFSSPTKEILAKRVGFRCSNPTCRRLTAGPQADVLRAINVGVAAHITAAAAGGPRYEPRLSANDRAALQNGIWLCQTCGKLVDNDPARYTISVLRQWKELAERNALAELEGPAALPRLEPVIAQVAAASVLIPEVDVVTEIHGSDFVSTGLDYSVYPFVIEELVSVGISSLAVVRGTGAALAVPRLPDFLKERVSVIEPHLPHKMVCRLFRPLEEELGVTLEFSELPVYGVSCHGVPPSWTDHGKAIISACAYLYPVLYKLVLGMHCGLHVDIDISGSLERLTWLRKRLRSTKARSVFAVVAGVLASYRIIPYASVKFASMLMPGEQSTLLARLLKDEDYAHFSRASFQLGIGQLQDVAATELSKYASRLTTTSAWKDALEKTTTSVQAALPSAVVKTSAADVMDTNFFLPPVVSHERVKRDAEDAWLQARPAPLLPGNMSEEGVIAGSFIPGRDRNPKPKKPSR